MLTKIVLQFIARVFAHASAGRVNPMRPFWVKAFDPDTGRYQGMVGPLVLDVMRSYATPEFEWDSYFARNNVKLVLTNWKGQTYATESLADIEDMIRQGRLINVSPLGFGGCPYSYEAYDGPEMCAICADRYAHDHGHRTHHLERRLRPGWDCECEFEVADRLWNSKQVVG